MIGMIKNILSPRIGARITFRGNLSGRDGLTLQAIVQSFNLNGFMRIHPGAFVQADLEGPRSKIESLIEQLRQTEIGSGHVVLETNWSEYKKQYQNFRASTS